MKKQKCDICKKTILGIEDYLKIEAYSMDKFIGKRYYHTTCFDRERAKTCEVNP